MGAIDWSQCNAVESLPGKLGGAWVFRSSRVPIRALLENLEGGATVEEFLGWFEGIDREQVDAVLERAQNA